MSISSNLLRHWLTATPEHKRLGRGWYSQARGLILSLAKKHGRSRCAVAGVVAATSPRLYWSRNVAVSEVLLAGGTPTGVFGASLNKARRILAGAKPLCVLGGQKVRAFYRALIGDPTAAVIDVWMLRASGLPDYTRLDRGGTYERVVKALRGLAGSLRIAVADLQATLWVVVRGSAV